MNPTNDRPGDWPDLSIPGKYRRLVKLAERRLGSHPHMAEDVVIRAVIKWAHLSPDLVGTARIEQVVLSESYSALRSELRLKDREHRADCDRSLGPGRQTSGKAIEAAILRETVRAVVRRHGSAFIDADIEILKHLYAGRSIAQICASTGHSRYFVTNSRDRWRSVLASAMQRRSSRHRADASS